MRFVDSTIFLTFLTAEDQTKAKACYQLFKQAEKGGFTLFTLEAEIKKVVNILRSKRHYNLSQQEIRDRLYPLLTMRGLKLTHQKVVLQALDYFVQYAYEFEDCLKLAHLAQYQITSIYSYDHPLGQANQLQPIAPGL
ncbi:MAG: VapC toxin family PIN domain ribonuclease [Chloroflexota bacterium]